MTILAGASVSAMVRYLLSVNLGPLVKMTNRQALVFNALDMTISSIVRYLFEKKRKNENEQLIFGRGLGPLVAMTITSLTVGPINLIVGVVISIISQFFGIIVNLMLDADQPFGIV
jgi:fluoride ion exporter CrcB/FEX